jgi:hypothetical protein
MLLSDKSLIFSPPCRTKIGLFYSVLLNKYNVSLEFPNDFFYGLIKLKRETSGDENNKAYGTDHRLRTQ